MCVGALYARGRGVDVFVGLVVDVQVGAGVAVTVDVAVGLAVGPSCGSSEVPRSWRPRTSDRPRTRQAAKVSDS